MGSTKIKQMLVDIDKYTNTTMTTNIKERLDISLQLYMKEVEYSYYQLRDKVDQKGVRKDILK